MYRRHHHHRHYHSNKNSINFIKMALFKRKHFSYWIICILIYFIQIGYGLQSVPTWISLGLKSPFIEFRAEAEILSNVSVSLNASATKLNKNGIQNLGPFVYPIDHYNETSSSSKITGKNKDYMRKQHVIRISNKNKDKDISIMQSSNNKVDLTENPLITSDINQKKEVTIIELKSDDHQKSDDDYSDEKPPTETERKYIIPLALKNPTAEPRKSHLFQDSSTNIDDLKRHILMLQNLTKNDQSFQSKFVVFPNLQRNQTTTSTTTTTTTTMSSIIATKLPTTHRQIVDRMNAARSDFSLSSSKMPRPIASGGGATDMLRGIDAIPIERPTIVPQVFLQNDQTPMNDASFEETDRRTTTTTTVLPMRRRKNGGSRRNRNGRKKNGGDKSIQCRDGYVKHPNCTINELYTYPPVSERKLSRSVRSHQRGMRSRDLLFPSVSGNNGSGHYNQHGHHHQHHHHNNNAYKEAVNLNPDLCFNVSGLSYGQQKLCVLHTHIMPAVSRGARAAIQECKHQFKSRRWNCSTVDDDDSVFGPVSGMGSPEMAFVHAIAAAGVASFIARACRDGQLTSCGCSRSSRPKQLHDDWTWGGCGDDLEFGYKFAQQFIDIREKERKRGTRGLITIPQKTKLEEKLLNASESLANDTLIIDINSTVSTTENNGKLTVDNDDLLELQEKITKEILSSKLEEKEMQELQAKINKEILNSKVFNFDPATGSMYGGKKKHQKIGRNGEVLTRVKPGASAKARSMMNLHNNEAGRRAVIKKSRITCKCHGVSGSCSLITCWQQLTSMREIGEHLRVKYDEATQVKLNKRGRLQVKDPRYKVPTALDLVYLEESPDWCRISKPLQWQGTHNRICNKSSAGLDGCAILCCGRGYNTKKIIVRERCNCKFHWCCQVKCDTCVKTIEEYSCK